MFKFKQLFSFIVKVNDKSQYLYLCAVRKKSKNILDLYMKKNIHFFIFLITLSFISCDETLEYEAEAIDDFIPTQIGSYIDYEVDYIKYEEILPDSSITYQLRELISDIETDDFGNQRYVLERYTRLNDTEDWKLDSIWTQRIEGTRLVKTESNVPYVKLVTPVSSGLSWNGNLFNNQETQEYSIVYTGIADTINGIILDNTVFVSHDIDSSLLFRDVIYEVFSEGIGLVHKRNEQINFCDDAGCFGTKAIKDGFIYDQKVIGFGN